MTIDPTSYQTREITLEVRADDDARTFTGIGVPYDTEVDLGFWRESFAPGSVEGADSALILHQHRDTIGKVIEARDTDAGLEITGRISKTTLGDDVYTLMRDGCLTKLSIGFQPLEHKVSERDDGTEVITWTKVRAREFSVVAIPAYDAAEISNVRHAPNPRKEPSMDPATLTRSDLEPIQDAISELERSINTIHDDHRPTGMHWRSMGHFLKAVASGDEAALEFHRAYAGMDSTDGILKDTTVGKFIKLLDARRRLINRFSKATLPATGMSVDYYALESSDIKMGKQRKEGTDLSGPSKIKLKAANAPVETFGGWTEISRQAIERATEPALSTTLTAMGLEYARATEQGMRALYKKVIEDQTTAGNVIDATAAATAMTTKDWITVLVKAAEKYDESIFQLNGIDLSADIFTALATSVDKNERPLFKLSGQSVNSLGSIDLGQLTGDLAGISASLLPNADPATAVFWDSTAIQTLESPGAPAQLQDENIINLTKQYSLYGYLAFITPFPDGIVPVKFGA